MTKVQIILCNDQGIPTGKYLEKELAHTGEGKKHLAITVLIYNSKNQVLLQLRKHKRFDKLWDTTGATDLKHLKNKDETFDVAARRCLTEEYEIIEKIPLKNLGVFNYYASYGNECENEHCAILVGEYNGEVKLNPSDGYQCIWMDKNDFLEDITENSHKYTKWATEAADILKEKGFFN